MCELNLLKELLDKRTATKLILFVHESLVNVICLLDVIGLSLYKYCHCIKLSLSLVSFMVQRQHSLLPQVLVIDI